MHLYSQVRECLKLNPDHKTAFPHYKKVKKLVKQQNDLRTLIEQEEWEGGFDSMVN